MLTEKIIEDENPLVKVFLHIFKRPGPKQWDKATIPGVFYKKKKKIGQGVP